MRNLRRCVYVGAIALVTACGGGGSPPGSTPPNGPPTVTLSPTSGNAFVGQSVTLTWSSTNATSCTASGAWNGALPANGSQSVTPTSAGPQTYTIACSGSGGSANASSTITATTPALSVTNVFSPNAVTISTSEGTPHGFADLWQLPFGIHFDSRYGYGPAKLIFLNICLSGQVSFPRCSDPPAVTGPLSPQMLAGIDAGIGSFARSGVRLIIVFNYNFGPTANGRDAPIDVIAMHIDQLAPILMKHRDLIFALEAGFIGTWGEWHHSLNGNDTAAAHKVVLDKELSNFKGVFPVLVRYPSAMITYAGSSTPQESLGIQDDFYASGDRDGGTWDACRIDCLSNYTDSQLMTFGEQVSTTSLFKAEFGAASYPPLQGCATLDAYSYRFHIQTLSLNNFPPTLPEALDADGCLTSFLNKVGTRIELQRATLIGNSSAGGSMYVGLTMVNAGYGRVIRARPATLAFISNGTVVGQVPIGLQDLDLRQLASASPPVPKTFQFTVTVPPTVPSGRQISVALLVPDPAPSLTAQAAYALPLNSLDAAGRAIFDATTGYNTIGAFTAGSTQQSPLTLSGQPVAAQATTLTGFWGGDAPAQPPQMFSALSLDAGLRAALMRMTGRPRIAWTLTQSGPNVAGSATLSVGGTPVLTGTLTGSYANGALRYSVSVPEGAVSIAPRCAGIIDGLATVSATELAGSAWVRSSTCAAPLSTVGFSLTKQ
jgi:hypothetical protein